jgi:putative ABC transport system permease protein
VQPASRVSYRLAVAAPGPATAPVKAFVQWAEAQIKACPLRGVRVESLESGRPEMRQTLDRAEKFLNLVALLAALLAAVAVGIAARDFAAAPPRRLRHAARAGPVAAAHRRRLHAGIRPVGLLASAPACCWGWAVHNVFVWLLAGLVDAQLPPPGLWPALFGLGVGHDAAAGLRPAAGAAAGARAAAARDPARRRRPQGGSLLVLAGRRGGLRRAADGGVADPKLGAIAVGGFAVAVACSRCWPGVRGVAAAPCRAGERRAALAGAGHAADRRAAGLCGAAGQALAVGLLALVLLVLLRTDLISSWRQATPPDAPNRFVINLQPEQGEAFQHRAGSRGREALRLVPDDPRPAGGHQRPVAVTPSSFAERPRQPPGRARVQPQPHAALPAHNQLVGGRWVADEPTAL